MGVFGSEGSTWQRYQCLVSRMEFEEQVEISHPKKLSATELCKAGRPKYKISLKKDVLERNVGFQT